MAVTKGFKVKINDNEYGELVELGAKALNVSVTSVTKTNAQEEFIYLDDFVQALRTDQWLYTGEFSDTIPYTANIEVPQLKETDSIFIYAAPNKDEELDDSEVARVLKERKKNLAMVDLAECNTDNTLTMECYSKRPEPFYFWLRGGSVSNRVVFLLDDVTGELYYQYPDTMANPPKFELDEDGNLYMIIDDETTEENPGGPIDSGGDESTDITDTEEAGGENNG